MSATDRSELDGYEALVSELRANPPVAPERLRQRILEGAPGTRRRPASKRRRLVLVVVPVAAALAVGGALVHGFVSSGSKGAAAEPAHSLSGTLGLLPTTTVQGRLVQRQPARPANTHLSAAQARPKAVFNTAHLAQDTVVIPRDRLVHAVATLQVQVPTHAALSHATNEATQIVSSLGGYAQSVQYQSSRSGDGNAFLSLRV
ncbi:MAG TPA: hypothetical protein VJ814_02850, partial [Gaiellaceae bacterium]|nr:hypothetical protein [Gaiellaceae bacterium]